MSIVDSHFAHSGHCVPGVGSSLIRWLWGTPVAGLPTVITHEDMYRFDYSSVPREMRFGLLVESQSVIPRVYARVRRVIPDYELVFTHSEDLLRRFPNTRWIPGGGVWVGGTFGGGEIGIPVKTRMASLLTSNKRQTRLHRLRYKWAKRLEKIQADVDVYRQSPGDTRIIPVFETLRDYGYSIVIENFVDDRYFTEKVLNCFATGTVPIYLGARRLGDYFDPAGFIEFSGWKQLRSEILPRICMDDYQERLPALEENLRRVIEYRSIEDFIYTRYLGSIFT